MAIKIKPKKVPRIGDWKKKIFKIRIKEEIKFKLDRNIDDG